MVVTPFWNVLFFFGFIKEAIRYQQMQKELYEAKVSVMTSQIRPQRNSRSIYSAKNRTSLSGCPVFYLLTWVF